MDTLRKHAIEAIAIIWLVIVAVQYLSRYFIGGDVDYKLAYIAMLCLLIGMSAVRAMRRGK